MGDRFIVDYGVIMSLLGDFNKKKANIHFFSINLTFEYKI